MFYTLNLCGGGGIRTPDRLSPMLVFKTSAFNRSATPPLNLHRDFEFASAKIGLFIDNRKYLAEKNKIFYENLFIMLDNRGN